jgi:ribose transport system ATP-binding protein
VSGARLVARGIGKRFPGVQALTGVDLELGAGEVLAVLGENGAGKSTLMKILAGVQTADEGRIEVDGVEVRIRSIRDAEALGIALIHQELNLCDNLSVGASMFLGREPRRGPFVDEAEIRRRATAVLDRLGGDLDPRRRVSTLSLGEQQLVEIARAIAMDARIVIMDEPTSSLSQAEVERLYAVVGELRGRGVGVLYISHRLAEIERLADRVLVLRDGRVAGSLEGAGIERDAMIRLMVGRDVEQYFQRRVHPIGEVVLAVEGLRTAAHPGAQVDFAVRAGEVVALAGLVGAGRTEILEAIFGVVPRLAGRILVDGREVRGRRPRDAVAAGIALAPEDRKAHGLILDASLRANVSLARLDRDARRGFVDSLAEAELASRAIAELRIRTPDDAQVLRYLSGGNQQKVVLAKWLALGPRVLLLDEPTRGIDVGAKEEVYALIDALAAQGVAVLFASSELEEVLGISDRVLVCRDGAIEGELERDALDEEAVMRLATGGKVVQA